MSRKSILVVAAHPDDEVLGPGGTISAAAARGDQVIVYIAAEGVGTRHGKMKGEAVRRRSERAAEILGVSDIRLGGHGYDGTLLTSIPDQRIVREIQDLVDDTNPQIVLTHFPADIHSDHRALARAVCYATRAQAYAELKPLPILKRYHLRNRDLPSSQISILISLTYLSGN